MPRIPRRGDDDETTEQQAVRDESRDEPRGVDGARLAALCGRPADEKPYMIIVAGHAASDAKVPLHALKKKPLDRIASWL